MGLTNFLYRCPFCGQDPLEGEGLEAGCPDCGRTFRPGGGGTRIRVMTRDGAEEEVFAGTLTRRLDAMGGALARARGEDGRIVFESRVRVRFADEEDPIRFRDVLLGFAERFGAMAEGRLTLDHDRLVLHLQEPDRAGEERRLAWNLLDLRALQTSSSSVQISPRTGGVVLFRFPDESVKRWEELLRSAVTEAWREAGKGEVIEFQPRICAS